MAWLMTPTDSGVIYMALRRRIPSPQAG